MSSEIDHEVQYPNQENKSKQKEGKRVKQANKISEPVELQPGDALHLTFKQFDNKYIKMQSQPAENSRPFFQKG